METALSLIILLFVATAGINFGDAMVVRQRLTAATSRSARICAMQAGANAVACVDQQIRAGLGSLAQRCAPLAINAQTQQVGGVAIVRAEVSCDYAGGPWSAFLRKYLDRPLVLRASTTMPLFP